MGANVPQTKADPFVFAQIQNSVFDPARRRKPSSYTSYKFSIYIYTARSNAPGAFINLVLLHTFRYKSMCEYKCVRVRLFVQLSTDARGRPERYIISILLLYFTEYLSSHNDRDTRSRTI